MKKISKIFIVLPFVILALGRADLAYSSDFFKSIRKRTVVPSGIDTTVVFPGIRTNYSEIDVSGAFSVRYSSSVKEVTVTADGNLIPYLRIRTSGEELEIGLSGISINEIRRAEVCVPVSSRNLTSVELSGACSFTSDITLSGRELSLDLSGASKVELDVDLKDLEIDLSGASTACISGNARSAEMDCSGASKIKNHRGGCLNVEKASVDISGAGSIRGLQGGRISGDLSGAAKLTVLRGSDVSGVDCSGAARINVID